MTTFAEIAIDSYQDPSKKLFTYEITDDLLAQAKPGAKVAVPFGRRMVEGYIWGITTKVPPFPTKEIKEIKGQGFTEAQVKLAKWMSSYYLASPLDCLNCQIPGKGERVAVGPLDKITTLILIPYANQVLLRAALQTNLKDLLVGARSAVFAQLPGLKKIIIEEPENWNYKDERSPYYHVKEVAEKRAELEGLELELRYQVPRVEDLYPDGLHPPGLTHRVEVIDLNREKAAGNFTLVSQTLGNLIQHHKYTIVYVTSKELLEKIRGEITKLGVEKNFVETYGPELFGQLGKESDAVVWADVDTIFNLPDFRAHEKIVWTAQKLGARTKGLLYLQTAMPEYPLFKELASGNLESFYQRELKARQELGFPPYKMLIKLSFTGKSSAKVNFEAENLYAKLSAISDQRSGMQASPPYAPYSATPGKYQLNIAIKAKRPIGLAKLSLLIPPDWRVEVDPESLL